MRGIAATVVRDRVYLDGDLVEDGVPVMDVLRAATVKGARWLGRKAS